MVYKLRSTKQLQVAFVLSLCLSAGTFAVDARAQDASKRLSKEQVLKLLTQGDPPARVQYLVQKYGVDFPMVADTERALTQAGATQELMDVLRKIAPPKPLDPTQSPPPPAPVLVIREKPGEAEVYVDDVRQGRTSAAGTLKVTGLSAARHKVRISLEGYQTFEDDQVELVPGGTNTVVATLRPIEPPAPKPKDVPAASETAGAPANGNSTANPATRPIDPHDPRSPREPGIYYFQQSGNERQLVRLEPAPAGTPVAKASSGRGVAGAFGGFGGNGKINWKTTLVGAKAPVRLVERRPVFYFYFRSTDSNAYALAGGNAFLNASTPREFLLVRLESKKKEREIASDYTKNALVCDHEQIAPGIYKVQSKEDVEPGEYAFVYSGAYSGVVAAGGSSYFDFGIDKMK
jgi:hypothetical protein